MYESIKLNNVVGELDCNGCFSQIKIGRKAYPLYLESESQMKDYSYAFLLLANEVI